ncbi:MAG: hypothetical protein M3Q75_04850 [Gemmatimonadota bacterium]|nr:hypothetical protein [Gemmatimonadota bacterium]
MAAPDHDPDGRCATQNPCMSCKAAYWKQRRATPIQYTYGREAFHGPTGRELGEQTKAEFRARHGFDPEPKPMRAELI